MTDPMATVLGRLGYVRANQATSQTIALRSEADSPELPVYPQIVMIQGHSTGESWVRDHAGQLLLAASVAVLGLAALAVVALVAIAVTVAMVTCVTALAVVAAAGQGGARGRGDR